MPDPDPDDLARNEPGASALARARELRREHPLLTGAAAVLGIRTSARSFAEGARGERTVGRQLNKWAAQYGWHVLHAVPVGRRGADIDHVVIGLFGVVTVNTKATVTAVWVGEYGLTVGGKSVDYLRKSRSEASRAGQLLNRATGLEVPVQPAIVFVGARRVKVRRGGPPDVAVLAEPRMLHRWLLTQPPALTPAQVETIYQAARQARDLAKPVAVPVPVARTAVREPGRWRSVVMAPHPGPTRWVPGAAWRSSSVRRLRAGAAPTRRRGREAHAAGYGPGDDAPGPQRRAMARVTAEGQDHRVPGGDAALAHLDRDGAMPVLGHPGLDRHRSGAGPAGGAAATRSAGSPAAPGRPLPGRPSHAGSRWLRPRPMGG